MFANANNLRICDFMLNISVQSILNLKIVNFSTSPFFFCKQPAGDDKKRELPAGVTAETQISAQSVFLVLFVTGFRNRAVIYRR